VVLSRTQPLFVHVACVVEIPSNVIASSTPVLHGCDANESSEVKVSTEGLWKEDRTEPSLLLA
jgi:hypothetical protein